MTSTNTQRNKSRNKVKQLKSIFEDNQNLLIVMQDNPDPDSIAAAVALRKLANSIGKVQCSIAHGGRVGRGENRALVRYLTLNLRLCSEVDFSSFDLIAVVDTQPGTGNNSLPGNVEPDIVIDHHICRKKTRNCRFTDIRSSYGATVTILYEYLQETGIEIDVPLATAMLYAIRSDTQDLGRDTTRADLEVVMALYPVANKRMLSEIQRGRVQRDYFQVLGDGLKNARVYGPAIVTYIGQIQNPDMIAEIADLLLRDDETTWTLCYGIYMDRLLISIRTSQENLQADKVIQKIVSRKGTGGGHPSYAGGQILLSGKPAKSVHRLEKTIRNRFLSVISAEQAQEKPLIRS